MEEYKSQLQELLIKMPSDNYSSAYQILTNLFNDYKRILMHVQADEYYLKQTTKFLGDYSEIQTDIEKSKFGDTNNSKQDGFKTARRGLESDITGLIRILSRSKN